MVNTLRRKKDKDTPAARDTNGSASMPTSAPALAALQTSVEEKNRTVAAPLKVSFSPRLFHSADLASCQVFYASYLLHISTFGFLSYCFCFTLCVLLPVYSFNDLNTFCLAVSKQWDLRPHTKGFFFDLVSAPGWWYWGPWGIGSGLIQRSRARHPEVQ